MKVGRDVEGLREQLKNGRLSRVSTVVCHPHKAKDGTGKMVKMAQVKWHW